MAHDERDLERVAPAHDGEVSVPCRPRACDMTAGERAAELACANEALYRSVSGLAGRQGLMSFLEAVLHEASTATQANSAAAFAYRPETHDLEMRALVMAGEPVQIATDPRAELWRMPVPAGSNTGWLRMVERQDVLWIDNDSPPPEQWPHARQWHARFGHRTISAIPMVLAGEVLGFLGLTFAGAERLTEPRLRLCRALAQHASLAFRLTELGQQASETAVAREREQAARQKAAMLAKASEALRHSLDSLACRADLEEFLRQLLASLAGQVAAPEAALFLADERSGDVRLHLRVRDGQEVVGSAEADPYPLDGAAPEHQAALRGQLSYLSATRELSLFPVDEWRPPATPEHGEWHRRQGHTTVGAVALQAGGHAVGILGFAWRDSTRPNEEEQRLVCALAAHASLAIHMARLGEKAQQAAREAAVAEERARIAQDLHDDLAQLFVGLRMHLDVARTTLDGASPELTQRLEKAAELAARAGEQSRRAVLALRPPSVLGWGLCAALQRLVEEMQDLDPGAPVCTWRCEGKERSLDPVVEDELFRIAEEALANARRHAEARQIRLELQYEAKRVVLRVEDDGRGMAADAAGARAGQGLRNMRERARRMGGTLSVQSENGGGTRVTVEVP